MLLKMRENSVGTLPSLCSLHYGGIVRGEGNKNFTGLELWGISTMLALFHRLPKTRTISTDNQDLVRLLTELDRTRLLGLKRGSSENLKRR